MRNSGLPRGFDQGRQRADGGEMTKRILVVWALLAFAAATLVAGDKNPVVGGQEMLPTSTIMQNLSKSADHTILVSLLKETGLDKTLEGPGPFTIFAPINEAFNELPKGKLDELKKPENRDELKKLLNYHIVQGKLGTAELKQKIKEGSEGVGDVVTLSGEKLHVADHNGMHLMIRSNDDDMGMFNVSDVFSSNGVIHVVDNVMSPKQ